MDIDKSNVLQDEEYYYFFRALNMADNADIDNGTVTDDTGRILRIRTDRERYQINPNNRIPSKYSKDDEMSLEQVYDHVKINYRKDTNCVSLSSNANVAIDYGRGNYKDKYIIVKVPKAKIGEKVIFAGQYMLEEVEKEIDKLIEKLPKNSHIASILEIIENEQTADGYKKIVDELFKTAKSEGRYTGKITGKDSLKLRFTKKQYFTEEQQREYNRIIAKVTALELHNQGNGLLKTVTNSSLIATIGGAFSSVEWIHYKDIDGQDVVPVSKELMDILALTQQAKQSETIDKNKIAKLEKNIVELINNGTSVNVSTTNSSDAAQDLSIEKVHEITKGKIGYVKATSIIEFALKMDDARTKAKEYSQVMNELLNTDGEYDDILDYIEKRGVVVDPDIISRVNGAGVQISESVNLGFDSSVAALISHEEEKRIINELFEDDEGISDLSKINDFLERAVELDEEKTRNRYYAELIVDTTDVSKIYKKAIKDKSLTVEERESIIKRLEEADCERMYNSFKNAGVNEADISSYILNILADKGYKNYSFAELSRLEDLDDIISKNIENTNLRGHVFPSVMDKLRGINDDENKIEGTQIKLKDYQQTAVSTADKLYSEGKRFAGVVLPTGAGKSFVAITEMLKNKNANIVYIAPQHEILCQVQRHILKHISGVEILTSREIAELKKSQNTNDISKLSLPNGKILPSQAGEYVKKEFPHLKMMCYQGLSEKSDEDIEKSQQNEKNIEEKQLREILKNADANLIIFDELHRSGAKTWKSVVQQLIDTNSKANILGITATPIRDVDHIDMMLELARMTGTYSESELENKDYLGYEMYLPEAIQRGLVVEPELISFNFMLRYTDEYKELADRIENEEDETKKQKLIDIKQRMDQLINEDIEDKDFVKNNISDNELSDIGKVIEKTIKKKDGRYIVFLPHHPHDDGLTENEYFDEQKEKIAKLIEQIDPNAEIARLSSQDSKTENHKAITDFENSNSEHLKIMMVIDKLNEGVHVEGINGEIMYRKINDGSTILYLQQLGRVIYALDADNPIPEEEIPIVYDIYNNYLVQHLDRKVNEATPKSDLQKLQEIVEWIDKHGYEPDINSEDVKEARRAISLKRIQINYRKYIDGINNPRLSQASIHEIEQVMQLAYSIDLFNKDIGERIIPPGEKDLSDVQLFKVTATQKKFLELYKEANERQPREYKVDEKKQKKAEEESLRTARLNRAMNALEILSSHDIYIDNDLIKYGDTLGDVLEKCPKVLLPTLKEEFFSYNDDYPIGNEYNYAKETYKDHHQWKYYNDSDVRQLYFCGIFEKIDQKYLEDNYNYKTINSLRKEVLESDFVLVGPAALRGLNVKTGTYYNEKGETYEQIKENERAERRSGTHDGRLDKVINTLEVLSSHGVIINNELIQYRDTFEDVLKKCPKELEGILKRELSKYNSDYPIGNEYNFAKEVSKDYKQWKYYNNLEDLDVRKLYVCGIFEKIDEQYLKDNYGSARKNHTRDVLDLDFVIIGPSKIRGLNVKTGTRYNENGETYEEIKMFNEDSPEARVDRAINVLNILRGHGIVVNNELIQYRDTLDDVLKKCPENLQRTLREELYRYENNYYIGNDYNLAKSYFKDDRFWKYYEGKDVRELYACGIFEPIEEEFLTQNVLERRKNKLREETLCENFVINGPKEFQFLNVNTGTRYNERGETFNDIYMYYENTDPAKQLVCIKALEILSGKGIVIDNNLIQYRDKLEDVLKKCPEELQKTLREEFFRYDSNYPIGNEYNSLKIDYRQNELVRYSIGDNYVKWLYKNGILESIDEEFLKENFDEDEQDSLKEDVLYEGFVVDGPKELKGLHVKTGTDQNEKGETYEDVIMFFENTATARLDRTMKALNILRSHGIVVNNELIQYRDTLDDVLKKCPEELQKTLREELYRYKDDYIIGDDYNFAKVAFRENKPHNYYKDSDVSILYECGIFERIDENYRDDIRMEALYKNFVICGPKKLYGLHVRTGTKYNEEGETYEKIKAFEEGQGRRIRLDRVLKVLDILSSNGVTVDNELIKYSDTLEEMLKKCPEEIQKTLRGNLGNYPEDYSIGYEFNYAKENFKTPNWWTYFNDADVRKLYAYGIFEKVDSKYIEENCEKRSRLESDVLKDGFVILGPPALRGLNINTGTKRDERGIVAGEKEHFYDVLSIIEKFYKDIDNRISFVNEKTSDIPDGTLQKIIYNLKLKADIEKKDNISIKYEILQARELLEKLSEPMDQEKLVKLKKCGILPIKVDDNGIEVETGLPRKEFGRNYREYLQDKRFLALSRILRNCIIVADNQYSFANSSLDELFDSYLRNKMTKVFHITKAKEDAWYQIPNKHYSLKQEIIFAREYVAENYPNICEDKEKLTSFKELGILPLKLDENGIDVETGLPREYFKPNIKKYYEEEEAKLKEQQERKAEKWHASTAAAYKEIDRLKEKRRAEREKELEKARIEREKRERAKRQTVEERRNFNKEGFNKEGEFFYKNKFYTYNPLTGKKMDGTYAEEARDERGFNPDGTYKETGERYDESGLDVDFKNRARFDTKYHFDKDGFYYSEDENGQLVNTGLKYNPYGFDADKRHIVTRSRADLRKFTIDGICLVTKSIYDQNGYKQDGTFKETGVMYYQGYNAFDLDEDGRDRKGRMPLSIAFTREFLQGVNQGKVKDIYRKYRAEDPGIRRELLCTATIMCPKIKTEIANYTAKYVKMINARTMQLKALEEQEEQDEEKINKLKQENKILRARIDAINPFKGFEK